jgi:GAF domain-containing protein
MEAKSFCRANAGILLLHNTQERNLRFEIVRDNAQNLALGGTTGKKVPFSPLPLYKNDEPNQRNVAAHVALNGVSVNIPNTGEAEAFDFSDQKNGDMEINYHIATSMLSIPLKNSDNQILGVLQLLDAKDPESGQIVPFDPNLQQLMESFSSLAAAALEAYIREQGLRREIQQLRIEIDEAKRQKEVTEIIETDFFQDLQAKARTIRERGRRSKHDRSDPTESDS